MTRQLDLLEHAATEAMRQREIGMARALGGAETEYRERLLTAIGLLAAKGTPFTADEARAIAGDPPIGTHPNVAGAIFNAASKAGRIRPTGFGRSVRIVGHGNRIVLWIGVAA